MAYIVYKILKSAFCNSLSKYHVEKTFESRKIMQPDNCILYIFFHLATPFQNVPGVAFFCL